MGVFFMAMFVGGTQFAELSIKLLFGPLMSDSKEIFTRISEQPQLLILIFSTMVIMGSFDYFLTGFGGLVETANMTVSMKSFTVLIFSKAVSVISISNIRSNNMQISTTSNESAPKSSTRFFSSVKSWGVTPM